MSDISTITDEQIEERVLPQSLEKGKRYYRNGRVGDCVRRGTTLEASVQGSSHKPYHVEVEHNVDGDIQKTRCTCPYDWGGDCKHIVAVLLMWKNAPDRFHEKNTTEHALEQRSREELITLVELMLEREPSLRSLLDQDLPGSTGDSVELSDPDVFRPDVRQMISSESGYGPDVDLNQLLSLVEQANRHLRANEYGHAYGISRAVAEEVLDIYNMLHDHRDIDMAVDKAVSVLEECLEGVQEHPDARWDVIDALFRVIEWNINIGGIGMAESSWETIMEHAKREDRERLMTRIERYVSDLHSDLSSWTENTCGDMLIDLYTSDNRVEEFITIARELEMHRVLAHFLLERDRTAEAVDVATEHVTHPRHTIKFADHLLERGDRKEAHTIVEQRADRDDDDRLRVWLSEFEEQHGDPESSFRIERDRFRKKPNLAKYERLCELAEQLGTRTEVEEELREKLEQQEKWAVLAEIHLDDKNWDRAWNYAKRVNTFTGGRSMSIREKIIREGEHARPERAVEYYTQKARNLIDQRGRDNYASAAEYLQRVKAILKRENREAEWTECIDEFRSYASNLPACQDEFNKAQL